MALVLVTHPVFLGYPGGLVVTVLAQHSNIQGSSPTVVNNNWQYNDNQSPEDEGRAKFETLIFTRDKERTVLSRCIERWI